MKNGPDISRVAALIGDPARCNMLLAMMDGRALTASELANAAGVTKQTASAHLAKLLQADLLAREVQGRHHYYRIQGSDVANAIEALLNVAASRSGTRTRSGPKDPALRKARICYDHLAGETGVFLYDRMMTLGWIETHEKTVSVSAKGWEGLAALGIEETKLPKSRRPLCKTCLDWSMRRHHLAGKLGKSILDEFMRRKWAARIPDSRIIAFTSCGEHALKSWLS